MENIGLGLVQLFQGEVFVTNNTARQNDSHRKIFELPGSTEYSLFPMSSLEKEMNLYKVQWKIRGFEKGLLVYDPIFDHICDSRRKYTYLSELPYETILSDLSYEERVKLLRTQGIGRLQ